MIATIAPLLLLLCAPFVAAQDEPKPPPIELRVPFAAGERQTIWRGPGEASHQDRFNRYAVDFSPLAEGHAIVSATAGKVVFVKQSTPGPTGVWQDNNEVAVLMPNGKNVVVYLHLMKDGANVAVGDQVLPGDPIGRAGNTGNSSATHLHIDVRIGHRLGPSVPWRFAALKGKKIRTGMTVPSENIPVRSLLKPLWTLRRAMELARSLDEPTLVAARVRKLAKQKTKGMPDELVAQRQSLLDSWSREEQGFLDRIREAREPSERVALALTMNEAFANKAAFAAAVKGVPATVLAAERQRARMRLRSLAPLKKALELEAKLIAGDDLPTDKQRKQLRVAFDRACQLLSGAEQEVARKHASRVDTAGR